MEGPLLKNFKYVEYIQTDCIGYSKQIKEFDRNIYKELEIVPGQFKRVGGIKSYTPPKYPVQLLEAMPGSGKTWNTRDQVMNMANPDEAAIITISNSNKYEYLKVGLLNVYNYQYLTYQNQYNFLKQFKVIYVDEVYMVEIFVVFKLFELGVPIVFIGDRTQQCHMKSRIEDYDFLTRYMVENDIEIKKLTENRRNDIDYDTVKDIPSCRNHAFENGQYIHIDYLTPEYISSHRDHIFLCRDNTTCFYINKIYQTMVLNGAFQGNAIGDPTQVSKFDTHTLDRYYSANQKCRCEKGCKCRSKKGVCRCKTECQCKQKCYGYYGNAITIYKSQGQSI